MHLWCRLMANAGKKGTRGAEVKKIQANVDKRRTGTHSPHGGDANRRYSGGSFRRVCRGDASLGERIGFPEN